MNFRRWNWPLWAGFLLSIAAFFSYFAFFVNFPVTRDFPWANLLLFGLAAVLLVLGLRRAYTPEATRRRRILASTLAVLSIAIFGFFSYGIFVAARQLPSAKA